MGAISDKQRPFLSSSWVFAARLTGDKLSLLIDEERISSLKIVRHGNNQHSWFARAHTHRHRDTDTETHTTHICDDVSQPSASARAGPGRARNFYADRPPPDGRKQTRPAFCCLQSRKITRLRPRQQPALGRSPPPVASRRVSPIDGSVGGKYRTRPHHPTDHTLTLVMTPTESTQQAKLFRPDYNMRTKCAISDAFVRDCVFAYCSSVAQYVYSLLPFPAPCLRGSLAVKPRPSTSLSAVSLRTVQSAQSRTRSSEIAFLRTVLVWLSTCIP